MATYGCSVLNLKSSLQQDLPVFQSLWLPKEEAVFFLSCITGATRTLAWRTLPLTSFELLSRIDKPYGLSYIGWNGLNLLGVYRA